MTQTRRASVAVRGVTKRLGAVTVLRNLDLELSPGAVCGILGANGSGKSTLLRLLAGELLPDAGSFALCGQPLLKRRWFTSRDDARQHVAYLPDQNDALTELTGYEFLNLHYALRGDAVATFPWADTTVAPAICYDLRFPELFRAAVGQGAQVLAVIANWPAVRQAHWTALLAARAIENQCYVVGCNRAGDDPANHYAGGSIVIDPRGNVVAGAGAAPCVLQAALDLPALRAYRQNFPALADIRRDLFA